MKKKKYSFDDHPEHLEELEKIKQKYIKNAFRTDPMTDHDRDQMRVAMRGLYKNANIPYPGDHKIIFVPSPLIAQFASGIAMGILHGKEYNAAAYTADAAADAARNAAAAAAYTADAAAYTADARNAARNAAAYTAAADADAAAYTADAAAAAAAYTADAAAYTAAAAARNAAAYTAAADADADAAAAAADAAARNAAAYTADAAAADAAADARNAARNAAAYTAAADAEIKILEKSTSLEIFLNVLVDLGKKYGKFSLFSISFSWRYRTRSSLWPWYQVFGDFFKNVAKLPGEWEKWTPLNLDALHGGVRFMTPEFTIISDRPEILKLDEQNRLHCETNCAVKWRDGMEQYYWHGTMIPDWWIVNKKLLTPQIALTWENVEQRRCACEILGWHNVLEHESLNPKIIDKDLLHIGTLIEVDLPDAPKQRFIKYQCGTGRFFAESVNDKSFDTALKANAGGNGYRQNSGDDPESYIPFLRT